ncbi:hypothetical protein, partial [Klebsiella pneumoniae]|uniref:hypothetical protein n=1 Tax=Klebsiella pneumoniae TaxID=573 RepID=UPI001BDF93B3
GTLVASSETVQADVDKLNSEVVDIDRQIAELQSCREKVVDKIADFEKELDNIESAKAELAGESAPMLEVYQATLPSVDGWHQSKSA